MVDIIPPEIRIGGQYNAGGVIVLDGQTVQAQFDENGLLLVNSAGSGGSGATSLLRPGHITTGGTVQFATGILGAPPNGYELQNCSSSIFLYVSEATSVWVNGAVIPNTTQNEPGSDGWNEVPLFGTYYSPIGYKPNPLRGLAVYSPLTNHRFILKSW